jgi:hypothetical protein
MERCGLDASGLGQRLVAGSYEHGNEPLGSRKGGEFHHLPVNGLNLRGISSRPATVSSGHYIERFISCCI